ncbi:hypothetical protein CLU83_2053 [Flavobacterium sp. 1]|uniref:hypothetical protein n=1 Tax=Flavobacterium sp. 1 TaxID=2035200 RepID=UPI000C241DEE|nr:hypothetical protein [Flavobacterium sp. 1]PJJ08755.1 hypothetical protein CLU83_2053 [Flavobacterium sp. 1]
MKTKIQLAAIIATFFTFQMNAQNRTTINAMNSDISDNLDLTAVSSIFGESQNLNDFERRLNDPKLQISNLDLNNDNQVDYLRVIESVENNTHIIIIQSILGRDLYQDVATIEVERDRSNKISIQIVGNSFIYGQNYIYEPQYCLTPQIYASFWTSYYRPYYSSWTWNFYPNFYVAWNPYSVFRYRKNVYGCVNYRNTYNYVNYRRCYRAPAIYTSYSCNSYERRHPDYAFSKRNNNYSNHYELNQRRYSNGNRNEVAYSRNNPGYNNSQREYSQNRASYSRATNKPMIEYQKDYSQNRTNSPGAAGIQRTEPQRNYSQNRENTSRENYNQKDYSQNTASSTIENNTQITQPQRDYSSQNRNNISRENNSQNTNNSSRENNTQRVQPQRDYSQNRNSTPRENNTQRSEPQRSNENTSRGGGRRI